MLRARDSSVRRLLGRLGPANPGNTVEGRVVVLRRRYHDESYGFRRVREFTMPDCMSLCASSFRRLTHALHQTPPNN